MRTAGVLVSPRDAVDEHQDYAVSPLLNARARVWEVELIDGDSRPLVDARRAYATSLAWKTLDTVFENE